MLRPFRTHVAEQARLGRCGLPLRLLQAHELLVGDVELAIQHRVARRILVDVRRPVPDPLPGDEDRQLHVQLDLAHLEGRGVPVAHQVVDQAAVVADLLGAAAVGDPRRLHDGGVVAHIVDDADEAVVEHRDRLVEQLLERRHGGAPRRGGSWPAAPRSPRSSRRRAPCKKPRSREWSDRGGIVPEPATGLSRPPRRRPVSGTTAAPLRDLAESLYSSVPANTGYGDKRCSE